MKKYKLPQNKVLVLRTCNPDMTSRNGFVWPMAGAVECPDWKPIPECGNGLHGLLWGEGDSSLLDWGDSAKWLVVEVNKTDMVDLNQKVKFPSGVVVACGDRATATQFMFEHATKNTAIIGLVYAGGNWATLTGGDKATLTGGDKATLTGGNKATLTGGNWATLTGGNEATLTGGNEATLTGGNWATLTGGNKATLTGGNEATLTGGNKATLTGGNWATLTGGNWATLTGGNWATLTGGNWATLTGGEGSVFIIRYFNGKLIFVTAVVGDGDIKPNTPYKYDGSVFVEVK